MRKPKDYIDAGRSDPLDPQQLREHPYDFVSLPDKPAQGQPVSHDRLASDRWSGVLHFRYRTEVPMHVGSGVLETAEQCGLAGGGRKVVRGIVRRAGRPILPGSGWKGAVRSRFEAMTRSRLSLVDRGGKESSAELPDALLQQLPGRRGSYGLTIADPKVASLAPLAKPIGNLQEAARRFSPAEALFGGMGYRGRVCPGEGEIRVEPATEALSVPPLESPRMHRLAKPEAIKAQGTKLVVSEVEGRKAYYDGPVLRERNIDGRVVREYIDQVPPGAEIRLNVQVHQLSEAELGALLVAAGYGDCVGVLRFGGFKPAGLGKVSLLSAEAKLRRGAGARSYRQPEPGTLDLDAVVEIAKASGLIDAQALEELHQITTRRRPEELSRLPGGPR